MDSPVKFRELLTDWYEISMLGGYFHHKKINQIAVFDLFFRHLPRNRDYVIAAGLEQAVDYLKKLRFDPEAVDYIMNHPTMKDFPARDAFRKYLETFHFTGTVLAIPEGTPVFPNEPILEIIGPLGEVQMVETYLLSTIGHQSLVASKASRVVQSAQGRPVLDFGSRRAHGPEAGLFGARAAYIAGCESTSNVLAGKMFGIPTTGTQAHSWVQSFPTELAAFEAYAKTYPNNTILLIDTYNLAEGARNAVTVAKELEKDGHPFGGVRIDSGNLGEETATVRGSFQQAGLPKVKIVISSDLNEKKIAELGALEPQNQPDIFGVGTEMQVSRDEPSLSVVYKLVEIDGAPCIKLSAEKVLYPGQKQVFRSKKGDVLALAMEKLDGTPLLEKIIEKGKQVKTLPKLSDIRTYSLKAVKALSKGFAVKPSDQLTKLVKELKQKISPGSEINQWPWDHFDYP